MLKVLNINLQKKIFNTFNFFMLLNPIIQLTLDKDQDKTTQH